MTDLPDKVEALMERYLDGDLDEAERSAFERELLRSPELRAQVEAQRHIDGSLRRLFSPPGAVASTSYSPAPKHPRVTAHRLGRLAAAAVVALAAVAVWWGLLRGSGEPNPLERMYTVALARGFTPEEVCTTEEAFAAWVQDKYGQTLYPPPARDGLELLGWSYGRGVSTYSGFLLARVDGREVLVMVDRAAQEESRLPRPQDSSLRQFRRRIGDLVIYELTPLPSPGIVEGLRLP